MMGSQDSPNSTFLCIWSQYNANWSQFQGNLKMNIMIWQKCQFYSFSLTRARAARVGACKRYGRAKSTILNYQMSDA